MLEPTEETEEQEEDTDQKPNQEVEQEATVPALDEGRKSRRAASQISFKEPSLRGKMRQVNICMFII